MRKVWLALLVVGATTGLHACGGGESADTTFRTQAESMAPTYEVGDMLDVDRDPESAGRGDVVVAHPPAGAEDSSCGVRHSTRSVCPRPAAKRSALRFVLRIVAAPRDRLKVIGGAIYINGKRVKEDYAQAADACESCNLPQEATIPKGHLFLMGDNRGFSADSRTWGPVPKQWIIGKVMGETG